MAFDGISVAALVTELKDKFGSGRFVKIAQPENDELIINIKNIKDTYRLLLSADASLPLAYITSAGKTSPLTAPNFCMLLRKYLNNAKITDITQPGLERIINFQLEHYNEMGDLCNKRLIIELMGKHSNIIFTDMNGKIIDSIKHVNGIMSSVREVLPGRDYFIPDTMNKHNSLETTPEEFTEIIGKIPTKISKAIYTSYTGISPIIAEEICYRAGIDSDLAANTLPQNLLLQIYCEFASIMDIIKSRNFTPNIVYENDIPKDFSPIKLTIYNDLKTVYYDSFSQVLETYYGEKNLHTRIKQRSSDLRRIVNTTLEKDYKKYELQLSQMKDTEKKNKYKIYGELLTTYGYNIIPGSKSFTTENYYDGTEITIPLDDSLSPIENAKNYYERYAKLKRTASALEEIIKETKAEIDHLESISNSLDIAVSEDDLKAIKEELTDSCYIKRKTSEKKIKYSSEPFHYISSDGFHIYVGKNNYQNEELTFKFANGNDWWFHSKNFPGSHVIVKTQNKDLSDKTFEEAAALAAYYSKGHNQDKVEIDYTPRKNVKKVPGAKPGFVIYHTYYSMTIAPDIKNITRC